MSIELTLERIATALETLAKYARPAGVATPVKAAAKAEPKASKPAAEPKPPVDEAAETEADEGDEGDTVGNVVSRLLKAQKRDEAVALLKKFGATSVSGVKKAKEAEFIAEGLGILIAA